MTKPRQVEVLYQFFLPDNRPELIQFQNAEAMSLSLWKIREVCHKIISDDIHIKSKSLAEDILLEIGEIPLSDMI